MLLFAPLFSPNGAKLRNIDFQSVRRAELNSAEFQQSPHMNPSLRTKIIAEWRGLPERKMRPDRWQSPAEVVPKLMQRLGLRERLRETEVIDAWSKIVGDFIAAHSAPVALREGVLYVRVLQPALHYELEQISKSEILRKLKQRFGGKTIRDVRFRVG
jgi:predicted nucleic acid-binding Zn ribbon protein